MEAEMKKFVFCFAILAMVLIIGCKNETTDNNGTINNIGTLKSVKSMGIRSLFASSVSISNGTSRNSRALTETDIKTLSYINDAGQNVPIVFLTSNDKEVILQISDIKQIGNKRIVADYSAIYEVEETDEEGLVYKNSVSQNGTTLIDMETGVLYDFAGYYKFLTDGETLYAIKGSTLYKIDLANIGSAIPLNNPEFNGASNILFKIKDKIICGYYSFDVNASFVPKQVKPVPIFSSDKGITIGDLDRGYAIEIGVYTLQGFGTYFVDSNNDIWFYWLRCFNQGRQGDYFTGKLSIDDEGQLGISDFFEGTLLSSLYSPALFSSADGNSRYYISEDGIAIVKKNPSGVGIIVESISKTISASLQDAFVYDNFVYWIDGTSIKRMELSFSGTEETIYSNDNIVNTFWHGMLFHSGDQMIFYQYFNATTVGTYSISISNLSEPPKLVSTSTVEIDHIIELQF